MSLFALKTRQPTNIAARLLLEHPAKAPATIARNNFPEDFSNYEFVRSTIVHVKGMMGRTLFAHMELKNKIAEGASFAIEMKVSLRDLINGHHPQAKTVAALLSDDYMAKVQ